MPVTLSLSRTEEQQKETDDLGLKYHTEFSLPCPYLSGDRHPHVAKPVRALSPVMEVEMKPNEGQAERKRNLVSMITLEAYSWVCCGLLRCNFSNHKSYEHFQKLYYIKNILIK